MALGVRASKDPNKNDENNNFDENYKKWLSAMTRAASKDLNENDENHDFDKKKNYKWKKISECNEMKSDRVERLERKRRKGQFWPKNYTKLLSVITWRMIGCKFYSDIDKNDENIDLGESYKNLLVLYDRIQVAQQKWLLILDENDKKSLSGMTWNTRGLGARVLQ